MANFYQDVISKDQHFNSTHVVSDLKLLEPVTRQSVQNIIADAAGLGVNYMVYETYRSQTRQSALFEQGATQLRQVGVHHYGLACDIVKNVNGQPSWKGDFSILGQLAHQHGLIWGGDWGNPAAKHSFVDEYHVQRCTIGRQPALFSSKWYPDEKYDPYKNG
jgi:D-alanyl-D-alanine carboxypeptidase